MMISQIDDCRHLLEIREISRQKAVISRFRHLLLLHAWGFLTFPFSISGPRFLEHCMLLPPSGDTVEVVPGKLGAQKNSNWFIRTILIWNLATYFRKKRRGEEMICFCIFLITARLEGASDFLQSLKCEGIARVWELLNCFKP